MVRQSHLLLGHSVRYLAQSAEAAGIDVIAVDSFGDIDTRGAAPTYAAMGEQGALPTLSRMGLLDRVDGWSYSSGFESDPQQLSVLLKQCPNLCGNSPQVLSLLADPQRFFAMLDELGICYPQSVFDQADLNDSTWLFKADARQGGTQVHYVEQTRQFSEGYFQQFLDGQLCSMLFAADGSDVRLLGFNHLQPCAPEQGDFRFSQLISGFEPEAAMAKQMTRAAQSLTQALGLRGINGLDFVLYQGRAWLLDVNARPPASLELYEQRLPRGGFVAHLDASQGTLPTLRKAYGYHGLQVVYAPREGVVKLHAWPQWVTDRPSAGHQIASGEPLCTVHAAAESPHQVAQLLATRARAVECFIEQLSEVAA